MSQPSQPPIPSRHGADLPHARRITQGLLHFIADKAAAEPSAECWAQLGQALNEGDPQADALVAWMHAQGMSQARGWFEQALAQGVDSVPNAPEPLRAFFAHVEQTPAWLDTVRLQRGARAMHLSGHTGMRVLRDAALMAGYQAGAINKTLVMTGALEKGAARRVAETTKWWIDCSADGGLERFGDGFKNTVRVRMIHALVRKHVLARADWDAARWGLPVNQVDMQATYLGFSVVFLLGQRILGTALSRQEAEDVMHFWRYLFTRQ